MLPGTELPITTLDDGLTATDLANLIFGPGVSVTGATFDGDPTSAGTYSNGNSISGPVTPGDSGIILSTGFAASFTNDTGEANQLVNTSGNTTGQDDFAEFNDLALARTFDSARLDVDFIPDSSVLTMDFVFSSEEYQEFENSIYQDFVGVWVNGSRVLMEIGNGDIDPGNVNTTNNVNMSVNNNNDEFNTEMDGFTITLSLTMNVNPGVVNSLRIAIADVADSNYDSNLLIAADAVQTDIVAETDSVTIYPGGEKDVAVLLNDLNDGPGTLSVTQINGVDVIAGDTVVLPTGQSVTLNEDGTLAISGDDDVEEFNFTYTIFNGIDTDVGFVNATSIPCFVAGTHISTLRGEVPVEDLVPGDLVLTHDNGPQPLRWIGTQTVAAKDNFAPIRIRAGTFGSHGDLAFSPQHRILVRTSAAEMLFGEPEVLVSAQSLIDGYAIDQCPGGDVTYVHLLFDDHQILSSDGLATESFLPGSQTKLSFDAHATDEIFELFPQINRDTGSGYSPAARRILKAYEAKLLKDREVA